DRGPVRHWSGTVEVPRDRHGGGGQRHGAKGHDKTDQQPEPLVGLVLRVGHSQRLRRPHDIDRWQAYDGTALQRRLSHIHFSLRMALSPLTTRCSGRLLLRTFAGEAHEKVVTTAG